MKKHVNELTEGMQRLCAVANRVVQSKGAVSRIELDLLMEELRHLYGVALQMGGAESSPSCGVVDEVAVPSEKLAEPSPVEVHESAPEPKAEEKMMAMMSTMAAMQPAMEEVAAPREEPAPAVEQPILEPVEMPQMEELEHSDNALLFDEVIVEEEPKVVDVAPEAPVAEPVVTELHKEPEAAQASLMDFLNQPAQRTLGESLAEGRPQGNSLEKKVDDLRTVININDKFSFMSELFHNNMKAYNDFIMHLNAISDRDEALATVQEMAAQQKWAEESATVQAFYRVFDKKF